MKHIVYFFSGTGNSVQVVKEIEKVGAVVKSMTAHMENEECDAEKVGFVFPIYYLGMPKPVHDFIKNLKIKNTQYAYMVCTMGWNMRGGAVKQMKEYLSSKGVKLSMGSYIHMPMNDFTYAKVHDITKQNKILSKFDKTVNKVIIRIQDNKIYFQKEPIGFMSSKNIDFCNASNASDSKFTVTDDCISCGICEKVCSAGNIVIKDGRPEWQHSCQMCLGCFHYCPQKAICFDGKGKEIIHYHNPECTSAEIIKYHQL